MNAATVLVHKFKQWAGECSRYCKHTESLPAAKTANTLSPLFKTTYLAVGRRRCIDVEQDHFLRRTAVALVRELEHMLASDFVPAGVRNDGDALVRIERVQIID